MKFRVRGALGGGFGGCENKDWEEVDCQDEDEASEIAFQIAVEEYEMYEGSNGIRTVDDIMNDDDLDEEEAEQVYYDERESWLDYEYELIK